MTRPSENELPIETATLPPQPAGRAKARTVLEQLDDLNHMPFLPRKVRRPR